jgi:hypothetical protein
MDRPARFPQALEGVPGPVPGGRRVSEVPGRLPVARWLSLYAMRAGGSLRAVSFQPAAYPDGGLPDPSRPCLGRPRTHVLRDVVRFGVNPIGSNAIMGRERTPAGSARRRGSSRGAGERIASRIMGAAILVQERGERQASHASSSGPGWRRDERLLQMGDDGRTGGRGQAGRPRRRSQTEIREDLFDDNWIRNGGDQAQPAAAA